MTMQPPNYDDPAPGTQGPASRPIEPLHPTGPITGWRRQTHPTGGRGTGNGDLPDLSRYPATPRYDLATVAEFVTMRPVTLWSWEQNLGIPPMESAGPATTGMRYSERDLIALIWLRDQIVEGANPELAAQRLREAYTVARLVPPGAGPSSSFSRPLSGNPPSMPLGRSASQPIQRPPSQPIQRPPSQPIQRPMTQPIQRPATGEHSPMATGPATYGGPVAAYDLRAMAPQLLRALTTLDGATAARYLDEAFVARSAETVCQALMLPVLARLTELCAARELTHPELLFGVNLFKARLFRLFDVQHEHAGAPLMIVACGPDETHEIEALTLALFWRRAGLRVVYLGQGVDASLLGDMARRHRPHVIGLTISSPGRLRLVRRLANDLGRIDAPRPALALVGSAFARHPELIKRAGGVFLGPTPGDATQQVRNLLRPVAQGHG